MLESLLLGADGWVSGLVNAFPAENRLLWDLATAGRWDEAREVYRWYTPLLHLDTHVKLVQYIKLARAGVRARLRDGPGPAAAAGRRGARADPRRSSARGSRPGRRSSRPVDGHPKQGDDVGQDPIASA